MRDGKKYILLPIDFVEDIKYVKGSFRLIFEKWRLQEGDVYKILLVEDHVPFRKSFREVLERRFHQILVEEAGNGKEALEKMDSFCPNLIFMDIRLPDANGLELTQRIKRDCPETIIIILTSYDLPEYRETAKEYGANNFITKDTLSEEEIVAKVKTYHQE